jgi:hypothetical protein
VQDAEQGITSLILLKTHNNKYKQHNIILSKGMIREIKNNAQAPNSEAARSAPVVGDFYQLAEEIG